MYSRLLPLPAAFRVMSYRKSLGRGEQGFLSESVLGYGCGDVSLGLYGFMGGSADAVDLVRDLLRRRLIMGGNLGVIMGELKSSVLLVRLADRPTAVGVSGGWSSGDGTAEITGSASTLLKICCIMFSMDESLWVMECTSVLKWSLSSSILHARTSRSSGGGRSIIDRGGGGDGAS